MINIFISWQYHIMLFCAQDEVVIRRNSMKLSRLLLEVPTSHWSCRKFIIFFMDVYKIMKLCPMNIRTNTANFCTNSSLPTVPYSRKLLEGLIFRNFWNLVHFLKINFQKLFSMMYMAKYLMPNLNITLQWKIGCHEVHGQQLNPVSSLPLYVQVIWVSLTAASSLRLY